MADGEFGLTGSIPELNMVLTPAVARRLLADWVDQGAAWVGSVPDGCSLLGPVMLRVTVPNAGTVELSGRVLQWTPAGMAVGLNDPGAVAALLEKIAAGSALAREAARSDGDPEPATKTATKLRLAAERGGQGESGPAQETTKGTGSLFHRMRALSVEEKKRLALRANQPERHFLSRDQVRGIHIYVLRNPNVTTEEVARFLQFPRYSSEAIRKIAMSGEWMANRRVQVNIVMHPATPHNIAAIAMAKLREGDLKQVLRSGKLGPILARAARERLRKLHTKKSNG